MGRVTAQMEPSSADAPVLVRPKTGWQPPDLAELWRYRDLLWTLGVRDVKVRYRQTLLGMLWAIIPPVFTMLIFNSIFNGLLHVDAAKLSTGVPYPLFSFCALVPWTLFANAVSQASNSLVGNQHLITKVYFPRLAIPLSSLFSAILDFLVCLTILGGMLIYYRDFVRIGWRTLTLPLFSTLALATALGVSLWLSALNALYRDVRYVVPLMVQLWMYSCPILYSSQAIPERWRFYYGLNPMVGAIEGFRWALLGNTQTRPGPVLGAAALSVALVLVGGVYYFRRIERTFADFV